MITSPAESYKLHTHRTPLLCAAVLLVGVLAPSIAFIWYTPDSTDTYAQAFTGTFDGLSGLLAIVFGGWLLGSEYRHGTVKRLLTVEPRRLRALTTKGLAGAADMIFVLNVVYAIGWAAARVVGSMNDVHVPWHVDSLIASHVGVMILFTATYSLSAITRSDTFAMVGTLAMMFVVEPLYGLIPKIGKYTMGSAIDRITVWINDDAEVAFSSLSVGAAGATMAVWLATIMVAGAALFVKRDV